MGPLSTCLLAATASSALSLDYRAPDSCPDRAAFDAAVQNQSDSDTTGWHADVRIERRGAGYSGRLELRDPSRSYQPRELESPTCEELIEGLSLIAAMAIRRATPAPAVKSATTASPGPEVAPQIRQPATAPIAEPATSKPLPAAWTLGLAAGPHVGPVPGVALAISPSVGWSNAAIDVRLSFVPAIPTTASNLSRFLLIAGQLDVCAFALDATPFQLVPCGVLQLGGLEAEGLDVADPQKSVRPWVAPGGLVRVRLGPRTFTLDLDVGLLFPIIRDRYFFAPNQPVHEPSPVSAIIKLGPSVTFW